MGGGRHGRVTCKAPLFLICLVLFLFIYFWFGFVIVLGWGLTQLGSILQFSTFLHLFRIFFPNYSIPTEQNKIK